MEVCEIKSLSGSTPILNGYKFVGTTEDYDLMSYSLPSSVRIYGQGNSGSTVSFNTGLVITYGHLNGGGLPRTLRSIGGEPLGTPIVGVSSWNNGLLRIGGGTYMDQVLTSSVHPPSNFPDTLKYIGQYAFYHSELSGSIKLKSPFIDTHAFEACSGITSFELDVSSVDNEGSYINRDALATYRTSDSSFRPNPPLSNLPLKRVTIKGYETIDHPLGEGFSYVPLLNKLEIEGNGNTTATLGEIPVKNTVIFGDGVKDIRGTYIWGWNTNGTAVTDTYCDSITFGKDITNIEGGKPWSEGVLRYGPYATNSLYITKDDGVFLPSVNYNYSLSDAFGACQTIYVPSVVYQSYLTNDQWQPLLTKLEPY